MANKPYWSKKSNNISICEWRNEDKISYSLGKRYNKNGQWVDAKIYYDTDLPVVLGLVLAAISRDSTAKSNVEQAPPVGSPPAGTPPAAEAAAPSVASDEDIPF